MLYHVMYLGTFTTPGLPKQEPGFFPIHSPTAFVSRALVLATDQLTIAATLLMSLLRLPRRFTPPSSLVACFPAWLGLFMSHNASIWYLSTGRSRPPIRRFMRSWHHPGRTKYRTTPFPWATTRAFLLWVVVITSLLLGSCGAYDRVTMMGEELPSGPEKSGFGRPLLSEFLLAEGYTNFNHG